MNRKDFKSAYDKITLSDECRAEMKNKLMAAMEQKNFSGEFEDDGLLHSTQEIKLAPRKRSAGKTAAIAGSAAAVIAVFAVGAGVMLSRNGIPQPQPVTSNGTHETSDMPQTAESPEPETIEAQDDGNRMRHYAFPGAFRNQRGAFRAGTAVRGQRGGGHGNAHEVVQKNIQLPRLGSDIRTEPRA